MRSLNPWPVFPIHLEPPVVRSLSLQFILQTLLEAFKLSRELQIRSTLQQTMGEVIEKIHKKLEKLYLFSLESPLSQKGGSVDKICFYSETLMQVSQIREPGLWIVLEKIRKEMLSFKAKLMMWKKMPALYPLEDVWEQLGSLSSILLEQFRSYFLALTSFLKEARSDENVLIYLIEHKEEFNEHLGPQKIDELLQNFFPSGHDQLRAVIYEGYTRRGFSTFFSTVEPLIAKVQWEITCQSQNML